LNTIAKGIVKGMAVLTLACTAAYAATAGESPPEQKLAAIKAKVRMASTIPDSETTVREFGGHYAKPGPSMCSITGGGLSGEDLYLLPDSTFIYVQWADIQPETVCGKGRWTITNSVVTLTDDCAITSAYYGASSTYLALALTNTAYPRFLTNVPPRRIVLLGAGRGYSFLTEHTRHAGDWEMDLLISGLEWRSRILQKDVEVMRREIMRRSWRPDYFREDKTIQPKPDGDGLKPAP
jgi:hypothetical protein